MREIRIPFSLDINGRVATTDDPNTRAKQHLVSYIATNPGERVMRPDFGSPAREYLFENLESPSEEMLRRRLTERVSADVRDVRLISVNATPQTQDSQQSALSLDVEFALAVGTGSDGVSLSATVDIGGA